jgi:hypothetical protein
MPGTAPGASCLLPGKKRSNFHVSEFLPMALYSFAATIFAIDGELLMRRMANGAHG